MKMQSGDFLKEHLKFLFVFKDILYSRKDNKECDLIFKNHIFYGISFENIAGEQIINTQNNDYCVF